MTTPLPSPRQVLTSLITSISSIPPPSTDVQQQQQHHHQLLPPTTDQRQKPNSLSQLDPAHRPLLTALHALFPALLLPALDLLDRSLVSRLELSDNRGPSEETGKGTAADRTAAASNQQQDQDPPSPVTAGIYHVRSAQPQQPRHHRHHHQQKRSRQQRTYIVHLAAWNCTCAAFAFSAFPGGAAAAVEATEAAAGEGGIGPTSATTGSPPSREHEFGGLSLDGTRGREAQGVPCCKHLLACLLADRWAAVLGSYVVVRSVGREEMAEILADV